MDLLESVRLLAFSDMFISLWNALLLSKYGNVIVELLAWLNLLVRCGLCTLEFQVHSKPCLMTLAALRILVFDPVCVCGLVWLDLKDT